MLQRGYILLQLLLEVRYCRVLAGRAEQHEKIIETTVLRNVRDILLHACRFIFRKIPEDHAEYPALA